MQIEKKLLAYAFHDKLKATHDYQKLGDINDCGGTYDCGSSEMTELTRIEFRGLPDPLKIKRWKRKDEIAFILLGIQKLQTSDLNGVLSPLYWVSFLRKKKEVGGYFIFKYDHAQKVYVTRILTNVFLRVHGDETTDDWPLLTPPLQRIDEKNVNKATKIAVTKIVQEMVDNINQHANDQKDKTMQIALEYDNKKANPNNLKTPIVSDAVAIHKAKLVKENTIKVSPRVEKSWNFKIQKHPDSELELKSSKSSCVIL